MNRLLLAVLAGVALQPGLLAAASSCHIHPPVSRKGDVPAVIGPFGSMMRCEAARVELFGGEGRCHCSFDSPFEGKRFSPPQEVGSGDMPGKALP